MHCAAAVLSRPAALRSTLMEACLMHRRQRRCHHQTNSRARPQIRSQRFAEGMSLSLLAYGLPSLTVDLPPSAEVQQAPSSAIGPKSAGQGPLPPSHTQARPCLAATACLKPLPGPSRLTSSSLLRMQSCRPPPIVGLRPIICTTVT